MKFLQIFSKIRSSERIVIRFGTTFIANILKSIASFLSGLLIARGLGTEGYGTLNFLLGTFIAIIPLFDMGTSGAFYTFLSQKRRPSTFVFTYMAWLGVQFSLCSAFILLLCPKSLLMSLWFTSKRGDILLAFVVSFLTMQGWGFISNLGEARRRTFLVQWGALMQAFSHLAFIGLLTYTHRLSVNKILLLLAAEYLLIGAVLIRPLFQANTSEEKETTPFSMSDMLKQFYVYSSPFVAYNVISVLYTFADRWLLQKFGGATQQGYWSIGQQFGNIVLITTSSMINIFWKEIADALHQKDTTRVKNLYMGTTRVLYFSGAVISCLLVPYSREILSWTAGDAYQAAKLTFAVMLILPIHTSLSQIQGIYLLAVEKTRLYTRIGISTMLMSIPLTYLFLAPRNSTVPGLALGSFGLAFKLFVIQFINVAIQDHYISKHQGWGKNLLYQFNVLGALGIWGWACKWAGVHTMALFNIPLGRSSLGVSTLLYMLPLWLLVQRYPQSIGLTPLDIARLKMQTKSFLSSHFKPMFPATGSAEDRHVL